MARSSIQEESSKRKNNHASRACNACRKKKSRCEIVASQGKCERCLSNNIECSIEEGPDHRRPAERSYVESLEHSCAEQKSRLEEKDAAIAALLAQLSLLSVSAPSLPSYIPSPGPSSAQPLPDSPLAERTRSRKNSDLDSKDPSNAPYLSRMGRLVMEDKEIKYYGPTSAFANLPAPWPSIGIAPAPASSSSSLLLFSSANNPRQRPGCEFDWARSLPLDLVSLTLQEHDTLIENFFKFFAGWGYRGVFELFKRDMREALSLPASSPPPKLSHYSFMLHNAILAVATAYSDDPEIRKPEIRRIFAQKAKEYFQVEGHNPSLSVIQALGHIAAFHSGLAEQLMGSIYFAMCARMAQAVGLGVDSSMCVGGGRMSAEEHRDRTWIYWSLFAHDKFWAFYVGCGISIPLPSADFAPPPMFAHIEVGVMYQEVGVVFQETVKLFKIANEILQVIYGQQPVTRELMTDLCLRLEQFFQQIPDHLCIKRPKSIATASPPAIMLHLAYNWLTIMIHRPFYREVCNPCPSASYIKLSVERCQTAAERILQFLDCFDRLHGLRYVPITANQIAFTAGTIYLLEAVEFADNPIRRRNALNNVRICVSRLVQIGKTWQSARKTAEILKGLLSEQLQPMKLSRAPSLPVVVQVPSEAPSRCQSPAQPMILDPTSLSVPLPARNAPSVDPSTSFFTNIPFPSNSQEYAFHSSFPSSFPLDPTTVLLDHSMHSSNSQASQTSVSTHNDMILPDIPIDLPEYPTNPDLVPTVFPHFHHLFQPLAGIPTNLTTATEAFMHEYQQPFVRMPFSADSHHFRPSQASPMTMLRESGATALSQSDRFRYEPDHSHQLTLSTNNIGISVSQPHTYATGSSDSFARQGQLASSSIYQQPSTPYQQPSTTQGSPFLRPTPGTFSPAESTYDLSCGWYRSGEYYPWEG